MEHGGCEERVDCRKSIEREGNACRSGKTGPVVGCWLSGNVVGGNGLVMVGIGIGLGSCAAEFAFKGREASRIGGKGG